jgi:hypothetical protein
MTLEGVSFAVVVSCLLPFRYTTELVSVLVITITVVVLAPPYASTALASIFHNSNDQSFHDDPVPPAPEENGCRRTHESIAIH